MMQEFDVVVVGGGLAGQTVALGLADKRRVLLVCKTDLLSCASSRAQGGISAVAGAPDTLEKHFDDTVSAGAGLNDVAATRFIVESGRDAIEWLIGLGVPFTKHGADYHLTKEGGHSERRIFHVDDMTGRSVQKTLTSFLVQHPRITVLEQHTVIRLMLDDSAQRRCVGCVILDNRNNEVHQVHAQATILATGGAGQVFLNTTAPAMSTGDGIALAWNAGCRVANLEFLQFHPTCMYYPAGDPFLITEAVRGEGGILRRPDGHSFMADYDSRAELAPRDIVSRAIFSEMTKHGIPAVLLDISDKPAEFVMQHFPNIYRKCLERGIDMTREGIPVSPASHYTCGGVLTDLRARTDRPGLYCVGEAAYTGLHGANRLASNSLLECVVMGKAAATDILESLPSRSSVLPTEHVAGTPLSQQQMTAIELAKTELRRAMWEYVGIVRSQASLAAAQRRIEQLHAETTSLYSAVRPALCLVELQNLITAARLILKCALRRNESRGCHYDEDSPGIGGEARWSVLTPLDESRDVRVAQSAIEA